MASKASYFEGWFLVQLAWVSMSIAKKQRIAIFMWNDVNNTSLPCRVCSLVNYHSYCANGDSTKATKFLSE